MGKIRIGVILFLIVVKVLVSSGYETFSMTEIPSCYTKEAFTINLEPRNGNSSGILLATHTGTQPLNMHCVVTLHPPPSYGIVVSLHRIDFQPVLWTEPSTCRNYLEIEPTDTKKSVRLCGSRHDPYERKSYTNSNGGVKIIFHAANSTSSFSNRFQITFTAIRKGLCHPDELPCSNERCIWNGLACNGHNNCGDNSDEAIGANSQCGGTSQSEYIAVVVGAIGCSLILIFAAAYFKRRKMLRQMDILSHCRQPTFGTINASVIRSRQRNTQISSSHAPSYGSTRNFRLTNNPNVLIEDPPPPYEEVNQSAPVTYHAPIADQNSTQIMKV